MKYRTLLLRCECGRPAARLRDVGFTPDHQLVLHWRCAECKQHVYVLKPLTECWRDCPDEKDLDEETELREDLISETDGRFLHNLGIKFQDDAV